MAFDNTFARKASVLQGKPVCTLVGNEAPFGYAALEKWATAQFQTLGNSVVHPDLGVITLDKRSVKKRCQ